MSTERWYWIKIEVETENDGATYLRRGPETERSLLGLEAAVSMYGRDKIAAVLRRAAEDVERGLPFGGRA